MGEESRSPGQPRGARGTVGHPNSALNLRLALALSGFMFCLVVAGLLFSVGRSWFALIAAAAAVIAAVDIVVIQRRRAERRRLDPQRHDSLFE